MSLFFRWNLVPLIIASKALIISQVHSAQEGEPVDFARKILPILSNKCFACHGPDSKKPSQLRLDSFAAATADRDGVRAIDTDKLEEREILFRIHDKEDPMPPDDAEKQLTEDERELLSQWVKGGGQ